MLENVLDGVIEPSYIHSIVVFMPDCEFKTQMPVNVFKGASWTDYVKQFKEELISLMKLKRIQIRIEKEVLEKSWQTNQMHVNHLKEKRKDS